MALKRPVGVRTSYIHFSNISWTPWVLDPITNPFLGPSSWLHPASSPGERQTAGCGVLPLDQQGPAHPGRNCCLKPNHSISDDRPKWFIIIKLNGNNPKLHSLSSWLPLPSTVFSLLTLFFLPCHHPLFLPREFIEGYHVKGLHVKQNLSDLSNLPFSEKAALFLPRLFPKPEICLLCNAVFVFCSEYILFPCIALQQTPW